MEVCQIVDPLAISAPGRLFPPHRPLVSVVDGMGASPLDEAQCVTLVHGLDRDIVRNSVSGETAALEGRCSLHVHASGASFIAPVGPENAAEIVWVRTLLRGQVFTDECGDRFGYDLKSGTTAWVDSFAEVPSVAKALSLNHGSVQGKVVAYISDWPKGAACLRWCLPHAATLIIGSDFDGRWISSRLKRFKQLSALAGLGEEHIVRSLWSVRFAQKDDDAQCTTEPFEDEFNISTAGLLHLVLDFAVGKVRAKGVQNLANSASEFIDGLVSQLPLRSPGAPLRAEWDGGFA